MDDLRLKNTQLTEAINKSADDLNLCKNEKIELISNLKIAQESAILLQKELDTL